LVFWIVVGVPDVAENGDHFSIGLHLQIYLALPACWL